MLSPLLRYGELQRAFMAAPDESLLDEITDIGRLMAVTGLPVESAAEVHGAVLTDFLSSGQAVDYAAAVEAAAVCLSELLLSWRITAESIGPMPDRSGAGVFRPDYLWFAPDGSPLVGDDAEKHKLAAMLEETGRKDDILTAVANRRILAFDFKPAGQENRFHAILCPFRNGSWVVGVHDVTSAHARQEAELQQHKLAGIGQLAGGIAHEINNLLQPILLSAQFVAEDCGDDADIAEDVAVIIENTRTAGRLVRSVLEFARRPARALAALPIIETLVAELGTIRAALPADLIIRQDLSGAAGAMAHGDRGELGQILRNLLGNSCDAMNGKGVITVSAERVILTADQAVRLLLPSGAYVRLTVADTGPGVPPEVADRIFEPFFTTKPIGYGTGLGLSIVYSIVNSWGGGVHLRKTSECGGAIFDIHLPRKILKSESM